MNKINSIYSVKYREAVISLSAKLFNRVNSWYFFFSPFAREVGFGELKK
ncbi:MAG: hypothetical protein WC711_03660 [Candidatus Staskawiczbacteria bacterium]|jgi:hypothetical protein